MSPGGDDRRGGVGLETVDGPSTLGGSTGGSPGGSSGAPELSQTVDTPPGRSAGAFGAAVTRVEAPMPTPPDLAATRESLARSGPTFGFGPPARELPDRIGRFVVLSQLGAGGMGVVYKAYDPELDRKVALKLLLGQSSPHASDRLRREAQAMARLSHPNVVPIFDVGEVGGRVFVAMDFIDGLTLSAWMTARHPWQEVVDLFMQAGRGLAAAHAVGLIHRDFKPDNVLLSRDEGTGELRVRVADFGLARRDDDAQTPVGRDAELVTLPRNSMLDHGLTRVGAVVGTPTYMSPEQHLAAPVDARTDQFSFCVALFEALYGERPFTGDTVEALATAASAPRRASPPPGSKVPRWLHRVCLRGMQPDREARFPDMDALLAELARRRSQGRNRWLIAGALAAVTTTSVALATRGAPAELCAGGPARLIGVWDAPVQEQAARAFAASGAVYAADAWAAAQAQVERHSQAWLAMHRESCEATARGEQSAELMDLRMACLDRRRQELAALTQLYVAADTQVVKRALDAALALTPLEGCADASALRSVADAPPPEQAGQVEAARTAVAEARSLRSAGKAKEALTRARAALELALPLAYPPLTAESRLTLGLAQVSSGEAEPAISTLALALGAALQAHDDEHLFTGLVALLEATGHKLGRDAEAASWLALAQGALARTGDDPEHAARLAYTQGSVDLTAGRFPAAEAQFTRALALREALHGPDSPRLASAVNGLGSAHLRSGHYAEAQALFTRATTLAEAAGGPMHPDVASPLNNLALSHERQGRPADAIAALRRAQQIIASNSGADHPNVGVLGQNIGGMLRLTGQLAEARAELDAARELLERKLGPEHPALGGVLSISGDVALDMGDLPRARADFQRSDDVRSKVLGAEHPDRALSLLGLGRVALAEGDPAAALAPLERAHVLLSNSVYDPTDLGDIRFQLARALWDTGDRPRARSLAEQARAGLAAAGAAGERSLRALDLWLAEHP